MGAEITMPYKKLGAWLVRANDTVYQALTDGFVVVYGSADDDVDGFTDDSNPPTVQRCRDHQCLTSCATFVMPVKKNDYWEITTVSTVFWIPLEP